MANERFTGMAAVLDAVRTEEGITQPELVDRGDLGRSIIASRVAELEKAGLLASDGLGRSTGGRAPRRLRLRAEAGFVLAVDIAPNELTIGLADLAGTLQESRHEHIDVGAGADAVLAQVEKIGDALVEQAGARERLLSVAVGMPEPVSFDGGQVAVPTMREWNGHPIQNRFASLWSAPVWMDDRVNLLALGERRSNPAAGRSQHMLYLGGGASIGAAVVMDGRLYRGARGLAGAIGHVAVPGAEEEVCRCGNRGCLDAVAGGAALSRAGRELAANGQSTALAAVLASTGTIRPVDISRAADDGDPGARALLNRVATVIGDGLATLVNAYNPDLVVVGGGMARAGVHVLSALRRQTYRHALPAATENLRIELSVVDEEVAGVVGAVQFGLDQIFSAAYLPTLIRSTHPPR
ncbi:ROK family transcriptional regulator [Actinoplanes sp. URMC 104]|uniref:ROK family transcriptional regulator n=1 Tax=Actinoplanes sp. URMC 104 TaxID=3423409 RepID=UPI003F1A2FA8